VGLSVTFRFQKMAEAGIDLGSQFGFKRVEGLHGELEFFSPGGMRRSRPTLADSIKIVGQGGVKAQFSRGEGHCRKIERG